MPGAATTLSPNPVVITAGSLSYNYNTTTTAITPNDPSGQNATAAAPYCLSDAANVTITVANSAATVVRTLQSGVSEPGYCDSASWSWDGTNDQGSVVPDGIYTVTAHAVDANGSTDDATWQVQVIDESIGRLTAPAAGSTISGDVSYTFVPSPAYDISSVSFPCATGILQGDGSWQGTGSSVNCLQNGPATLSASVTWTDSFGDSFSTSSPGISVSVSNPVVITAGSLSYNYNTTTTAITPNDPSGQNATAAAPYCLSDAANVTITVANSAATVVRTLQSGVSEPGYCDSASWSWDGTNDQGSVVPDGIYTVTAHAVDANGSTDDATWQVQVIDESIGRLTAPAAGSTISGDVSYTFVPSPAYDISSVSFPCATGILQGDGSWQGTGSSVNCLQNGPATLSASVTWTDSFGDSFSTSSPGISVSVSNPVVITAGSLSYNYNTTTTAITPNDPSGQNATAAAPYCLSDAANVTITVANSAATVVRTLQSGVSEPGYCDSASWSWDGTNDQGSVVPDGIYTVTAHAVDANGSTDDATWQVQVIDESIGRLTAPAAGSTISGDVSYTFVPSPAYDISSVSFPCATGILQGDGSWQGTGSSVNCLQNGPATLSASVTWTDSFGDSFSTSSPGISVSVSVSNPVVITAGSLSYNYNTTTTAITPNDPSGQNATAAAPYCLSDAANVTITVANSAATVVRTLQSGVSEPGYCDSASWSWDGTNDQGSVVPDGIYTVTAHAVDANGSTDDATWQVQVIDESIGRLTAPAAGSTISGDVSYTFVPSPAYDISSVSFPCATGILQGDGSWQGTGSSVNCLQNGPATLSASVTWTDSFGDSFSTSSPGISVSVSNPVVITAGSLSYNYNTTTTAITPNDPSGQNATAAAPYCLSDAANVTITVANSAATVVRTLQSGVSEPGYCDSASWSWDGTNDQGSVVPDGIYTVTAHAVDANGSTDDATWQVQVIDDANPGTLISPVSGQGLTGLVQFAFAPASGMTLEHVSECFASGGCAPIYNPSPDGIWRTTIMARTLTPGATTLDTQGTIEDAFGQQITIDLGSIPVVVNSPTETATGVGSGMAARQSPVCNTADPVNCASGDFWQSATDVDVPEQGPALALTRTYNSAEAATKGIFGYGWTSTYDANLIVNSDGSVTVTEEDGSSLTASANGDGTYTVPTWADSTLTHDANGTWTFVRQATEVFAFSSTGRLIGISDLNGDATTLSYNSSGQLSTVTDSSGRHLSFTFDTNGLVSSVTDPMGRTMSYTYDPNGNLIGVTNPAGGAWSYTYDANHLMLTSTDPDGGIVSNVYDDQGRVTSQTDPMGRTTTLSYAGDNYSVGGGTTTITDPNGNVETEHYLDGVLTSLTKGTGTAAAATWTYAYDPTTLVRTSVTDPNGRTTTYTDDANGNILSETDPLGRTTTYTYNGFNEPTSVTDPSGVTTTYTYDVDGNLTSTSRPLLGTSQNQITTYTYANPAHPGQVTASTDPNGKATTYTYDTNGVLASSTDPLGHATTYTYDADGEKTSMVSPDGNVSGGDPAAHTTTYTYDALGDLLSTTDPLGHTTSDTYNGDQDKTSVTDPAGHTTTYTYDADNELISTTQPDGTKLLSTYDTDGNVTSKTDAAGHTTSYTYDALNQQISSIDPDGHTTTYTYDGSGNQLSETNPNGKTTTYSYDADNELTGITYSDGTTPDVTYHYDDLGQRTQMIDGSGTTTYSYDSLGRLVSSTDGNGDTTTYAYDLDGNRIELGYPDGDSVAYAYDAANRLSSLTDWLGQSTSYTYDADGNVLGQSNANGTAVASTYDPTDELTGITDTNHSGPIATYGYAYNPDGLVSSEDSSGSEPGTQTYGYDGLSQLDQVSGVTLSYDQSGNLSTTEGGTPQTYDAADELTNAGYSYDAQGNRTSGFGPSNTPATYTYDQANRLVLLDPPPLGTGLPELPIVILFPVAGLLIFGLFVGRKRKWRVSATLGMAIVVVLGAATMGVYRPAPASATTGTDTTVGYTYNGDGLRTAKDVGGVTQQFTWDVADSPSLLLEDSSPAGSISYVYGLSDTPIEQITGRTTTFLLDDRLGSVRTLTDDSGAVVGSASYGAYGVATTTGETSAFGYAGEYTDSESGFIYLRNRYYDPLTGQLLTEDPLVALTNEPYAYAGNDPVNAVDPSGMQICTLDELDEYQTTGMGSGNSCTSVYFGVAVTCGSGTDTSCSSCEDFVSVKAAESILEEESSPTWGEDTQARPTAKGSSSGESQQTNGLDVESAAQICEDVPDNAVCEDQVKAVEVEYLVGKTEAPSSLHEAETDNLVDALPDVVSEFVYDG